MDEGEEVGGSAVEPRCETPEVLELVEAAFDAVAGFVEVGVMGDRNLARTGRRNDGNHAGICDQLTKAIAVVGFVGDDAAALDAIEQSRCGDDVMDLASGEDEAQRPSERIGEHVDFASQSSSGAPRAWFWSPLFRSLPAGGREPEWCRA